MRESKPRRPIPPEIAAKVEEYLQQPYHKVVSGNTAEGFLVEVMELPGCMTDGLTEAEALAQYPRSNGSVAGDGDPRWCPYPHALPGAHL